MSHPAITRARALVGTRFRPQGRDPRHGLDCVGLAINAYGLPPDSCPRDYRLRGDHRLAFDAALKKRFDQVPEPTAGDLLLLRIARDQFHLALLAGPSVIHAHAGLGQVVEVPGTLPWPVIAAFRHTQGED